MGKITTVDITKDDMPRWLEFRKNSGIGASEVGTVMGVNPYMSSIELFYKKIGVFDDMVVENIPMFMGNIMEPIVADLWKYWSGTPESIIENYRAGKIIRENYEPRGYILNSDYPHMFFSPDRIIVEDGVETGVLEIKTISGWAAKKWEGGVPPSYIYQLVTYMLGYEKDHGELCPMEDGRFIDVIPFDMDDQLRNMGNQIVTHTEGFWGKVLQAREAIVSELDYEQFAPAPDGSEAYKNFLSKQYEDNGDNTLHGTDEQLQDTFKHKKIKEAVKEFEYELTLIENELKVYMKNSPILSFGANGNVYWKADKNGNRRFSIKTKC
jgi:putative phage-type endonuclease